MLSLNTPLKLHPKAVLLWIIRGTFGLLILSIFVVIPLIALASFGWIQRIPFGQPTTLFMLIFFLLFIISVVMAKLKYKFFHYTLKDSGILIESGVITKYSHLIPYDKIQNTNIVRGLTARLLGLSDLEIQTAAQNISVYTTTNRQQGTNTTVMQNRPEGVLPGLLETDANELMNFLLEKTTATKSALA